jgi:hypothetical protein
MMQSFKVRVEICQWLTSEPVHPVHSPPHLPAASVKHT